MPATLTRTPLYETHLRLRARMVSFAGWEMPVQYTGIVAEHKAVRSSWGIFDVSHMGRIELLGPGAGPLLAYLLTTDVSSLKEGRARYSLMCLESGGILDDVVILRLGHERFLAVSNAANRSAVLDWMKGHARAFPATQIADRTEETAMLAAQGPLARERVDALFRGRLSGLKRFSAGEFEYRRVAVIVSRTGYTGEDGFELIAPCDGGLQLWDRLIEAGATPCGLGARDILRLEAGFPLHGLDVERTVNPFEAGLEQFVDLDRGDFVGRQALVECKRRGLERRLIGFKAQQRGAVPRHSCPILDNGQALGWVTSGSFSPTLGTNIGLGYVPPELAQPGRRLQVDVRGKLVTVVVAERPFYKRPQS